MLGTKLPGNNSNEERPSRRDFLLGIAVASAVAVPVLSAPARAAVSMLRTGLDPDLVETESEVIPAGKRGGGGGKGRVVVARAAVVVARAAVAVTMVAVANTMVAVANTMVAVANAMAAVANTMVAVANAMAAVANTMAAVANTMVAHIMGTVMAMDITSIDTVMVVAGGMVAGMPGEVLAGYGRPLVAGFGFAIDAAAAN